MRPQGPACELPSGKGTLRRLPGTGQIGAEAGGLESTVLMFCKGSNPGLPLRLAFTNRTFWNILKPRPQESPLRPPGPLDHQAMKDGKRQEERPVPQLSSPAQPCRETINHGCLATKFWGVVLGSSRKVTRGCGWGQAGRAPGGRGSPALDVLWGQRRPSSGCSLGVKGKGAGADLHGLGWIFGEMISFGYHSPFCRKRGLSLP